MDEINIFLSELENLYRERYVSFSDLEEVKEKFSDFDLDKRKFCKEKAKLFFSFRFKRFLELRKKTKALESFLEKRNELNRDFIKKEQRKVYQVEGNSLDPQQIEAVVACEDAELFLAPAGSGKSASLLAKIDYLVNTLKIPASRVLVIAFTNKVVAELKERVSNEDVEIRTFHSLGNKILKSYQEEGQTKKLLSDGEMKRFFREKVKELKTQNEEYAKKYNNYLLFYQSVPVDLETLKTEKERIDFNRMFLRQTLKTISLSKENRNIKNPTLNQEYVKSKEEQIIANWLFINNIDYEYERQYEFCNTKYKPDFTIFNFSEPIYYEHFAIGKNGETWYEGYDEKVEWKRDLHQKNNTILIETYSYEWQDGTLLTNLEKRLKEAGLKIERRREKEITELIEKDLKYHEDAESLESLFISVLQLQKSERVEIGELEERIKKIENQYIRKRALLFFELYKPIYQGYIEFLKKNNYYDFSDMLNESADIVEKLPENSLDYGYILVDEAQDLSTSKYILLKAILEKCRKVKLFAVGDDWQSIYRFAGSNLKVLDDFEKIFEYETYRGLIELTYRFGEPTAYISNKFIQKNPYQSKKNVVAKVKKKTPIEVKLNMEYKKEEPSDYETMNRRIQELYEEYGKDLLKKRIQVISRYNRDVNRLIDKKSRKYKNARLVSDTENKREFEWKIDGTNLKLTIPFCSMHKAKGITRDIVFVINMNAGMLGMPSTRDDDPVMATMLTKLDPYPFAEERRLFYVAITRAKEKTIIISDANQISKFVYEINPDLDNSGVLVCPKCKTGILVKRTRKRDGKTFYSCSNFINGCKYTE